MIATDYHLHSAHSADAHTSVAPMCEAALETSEVAAGRQTGATTLAPRWVRDMPKFLHMTTGGCALALGPTATRLDSPVPERFRGNTLLLTPLG